MTWTLVIWLSLSFNTLTMTSINMENAEACEIAARSWGEGVCINKYTGESRVFKKEAPAQ